MHWNDWNWECSNIVTRIGTQSIVATIISVYGPQENDLLKNKKQVSMMMWLSKYKELTQGVHMC